MTSVIGDFQPIYMYIKDHNRNRRSTYFEIPDILVFEKYIDNPLSPKTKEYRIYYYSGAITESILLNVYKREFVLKIVYSVGAKFNHL